MAITSFLLKANKSKLLSLPFLSNREQFGNANGSFKIEIRSIEIKLLFEVIKIE